MYFLTQNDTIMTTRTFEKRLTTFLIVAAMLFMCAVETHWIFIALTITCLAGAAALSKD